VSTDLHIRCNAIRNAAIVALHLGLDRGVDLWADVCRRARAPVLGLERWSGP
jgi:hypothetical protein